MPCEILKDRKLNLPKDQRLLHSVKISGLPFEDGIEVRMDFVANGGDKTYVRVSKKTSPDRDWTKPRIWTVEAIQNRDAKGLRGFKQYAEEVCIECKTPGASLANTIENKFKQISSR